MAKQRSARGLYMKNCSSRKCVGKSKKRRVYTSGRGGASFSESGRVFLCGRSQDTKSDAIKAQVTAKNNIPSKTKRRLVFKIAKIGRYWRSCVAEK